MDAATTVEMGGRDLSFAAAVVGRLLVPGRLPVAVAMSGRLKLNGVEAGARKDWPGCWECC